MIYNYFELSADFNLAPAEAIAFFRDKGLATTFSYLDLVGEEHNAAFTVAKMMDTDLLATVRDKLDQALANGETLEDFKRTLIPKLQSAGWWGKADVVDPLTGRVVEAQLGSASRLETIFRTNIQTAYAVGHWQTIQDQAEAAPYLLYDAVDDHRTRPDHAAHDGTVLPVGSPFWDTHYPPNGYNCRCGVIQLDDDELADYGLTPSPEPKLDKKTWTNPRTGKNYVVPEGTDPQFSHNPGKWRLAKIDALAVEKAARLAAAEQAALAAAQGAIEKARTASRIEAQASKALKELQKQETEGAFQKQYEKTKQRAAQYQIDEAIADKTPYLSTALKAISKTKAGQTLTPAELLDKAQEKAANTKQADQVNKYKKAKIAGKEPPASVAQAYQALDPEQKAAIDQEIDVKTGNYQAQLQIDDYLTGSGYSYEKKAHKKLANQGALDGLDAKGKLAAIQEAAATQKLKDQQAKAVKAYKANLVAGKKPTENQVAAFNALPESDQAKLLADVDQAPTPEAPAPQDGPNMASLTQTGPQKGSNPGGKYLDTESGLEWYIKTPNSLDNAQNEVLAGKLYQLAGVEVPDLAIVDYQGKPGIASKIIDGLQKDPQGLQAGTVANAGDNFAIDAWLANWDVVGLEYDNLLVKANRAIRVDTGGALRYRAQGGLKGDAFGPTVGELDSLRDPNLNPQAAAVFENVTDTQIRAGVARLAKITDQQIDDLVAKYAPDHPALAQTLKARRDDLMKRYPPIDQKGAKYQKALALAREEAASEVQVALDTANQAIITAIKGIGKQANEGSPIRPVDRERVQAALNAVADLDSLPLTAAYRAELRSFYDSWLDELESAVNTDGPAKWQTGTFEPKALNPAGIADDQLTVDLAALDKPRVPTRAQVDTQMQKVFGVTTGQTGVKPSQDSGRKLPNLAPIPAHLQDLIAAYTGPYYRKINTPLWKKQATPEQLQLADTLSQAIRMGKPFVGTSARGLELDSQKLQSWTKRMTAAQEKGKPVRMLAFTSSTRGPTPAFGGNVWIRFKGKYGLHVNAISQHKGGEDEILFAHNSDFMVESIEQTGGRTIFTLVEVDATTVDKTLQFSEAD